MALGPTLDEINGMPTDIDQLTEQMYARGYATPPPPPPPPAPLIPDANVAPMAAANPYAGAGAAPRVPAISGVNLGGAPDIGTAPSGEGRLDFKPMSPVKPMEAYGAKNQLLLPGGNLGPVEPAATAAGIDLSPEASPSPNVPPAPPASRMYPPWYSGPGAGAAAAPAPVPGMEMVPPEIGGGDLSAGGTPAIPSAVVKPSMEMTKKQAGQSKRDMGKMQWAAERPQITAPYGTQEYFNQRAEQKRFDLDHPLGADVSRMPGTKGKILHGLAMAGEIGGLAVAPGLTMQIPGTRPNLVLGEQAALREGSRVGKENLERQEATSRMGEEAARTAGIKQQTERQASEEKLQMDAQGNITGWWDGMGKLHTVDAPETPQAIKDVASVTARKLMKPTVEKLDNGDVIAVSPGNGDDIPPSARLVYHGDPKRETAITEKNIGGKPHHILVDKQTGQFLADLGEYSIGNSMAHDLAEMKHNEESVIAYDKDNRAYILPRGDVERYGLSNPMKTAGDAEEKAATHHKALNTMQAQLNGVVAARGALDQNYAQRLMIATALQHPTDSWYDVTRRATALAQATPISQEYVRSVLALREASMALPKETTGGSRVTEIQTSALWATLPDAGSLNGKYALKQGKKFQQDIDRLREGAPFVRSVSIVPPDPALGSREMAPRQAGTGKGAAGGGGKTYSQADVDAAVASHPGSTAAQVEAAFKKKGWTKQ